jgi:hypothetical protein
VAFGGGPARAHAPLLADGTRVAVVEPRARVLELVDARSRRRVARENAGVGPAHVATDGQGLAFVADAEGDGLLLFRAGTRRLELVRRVALRGGPYGVAVDRTRGRVWVTLPGRNRIAEVTLSGKPRLVRELPAIRDARGVTVDERTGEVTIRSPRERQLVDP